MEFAFVSSLPILSSSFTPITNYSSSSSSSKLPLHPTLKKRHAIIHPHPFSSPMTIKATKEDRTFIAVKPDGMNRALLGNIISRFESKGYKLIGIKTLIPSRTLAETHYAALSSKPFFKDLVDFITSGPVCAMAWQGESVVSAARTIIGQTNPLESAPGTIRGDYGLDIGRNVIHGSDAAETAEREISIWFEPSELIDWTPTRNVWIYE